MVLFGVSMLLVVLRDRDRERGRERETVFYVLVSVLYDVNDFGHVEMSRCRKKGGGERETAFCLSVHGAFGYGASTVNDFAQARERERDDSGRGRGFFFCLSP